MLRPPDESNTLITKISVPTVPSQSRTNIARTQNTKEKARTTNLTRFGNLPTLSGQKGEDLIQPTELQRLQSDPKI